MFADYPGADSAASDKIEAFVYRTNPPRPLAQRVQFRGDVGPPTYHSAVLRSGLYVVVAVASGAGAYVLGAGAVWSLVIGALAPAVLAAAPHFLRGALVGLSTPDDQTEEMSGTEFEDHVARIARSCGLPVIMTSITGDWGVDIIVGKRPNRLAIQCNGNPARSARVPFRKWWPARPCRIASKPWWSPTTNSPQPHANSQSYTAASSSAAPSCPGCGRRSAALRSLLSRPDLAERGAHGADRGVDLLAGHRQRGPEPHAVVSAGQHDHPVIPQPADQLVALVGAGEAERAHQPAAARVEHQTRKLLCQSLELVEQIAPRLGGPDHELFGLDDLEDAPGSHHIDEVAAPRRIDPGADREDVVRHLVDSAACHDAAHLRLLAERDHIGRYVQLLVGPSRSGQPAAGLHLVEDEQRVELVTQRPHRGEELRPEVTVAALTLGRLGDEACDVVRVRREGSAGLAQRFG